MPRNTHPSAYADIKPILDAALAAGGGVYRPKDRWGNPSPKAAVAWRARAYAFRAALLRHQTSDILGKPSTPYDGMVLRLDDRDPTVVLINKMDPVGELVDFSGRALPIGPAPREDPFVDPLIEQARRQAADLGILED